MRSFIVTAYLTSYFSEEVAETIAKTVREEAVGETVETIMRNYGHLVASVTVVPVARP